MSHPTTSPSKLRVRTKARRPRLTTPLLSVVIVNYCQWENTAALVRQIIRTPAARSGAVEVVVVDNHSPKHALAMRLRRWPRVSLRRWGSNRGFARAVNEGVRLSRGQWHLLLNPDLTLTGSFMNDVLAVLDDLTANDPRAGIVGFQLLNADGSRQMSSGSFPTLPGTLAGLVLPRDRRKYQAASAQKRCRVPWVTGCCLLARRACLREVGGLDETFFLYYEDVDLCRRARALRWSVWYEPRLRAVHHDPVHRRGVPAALRLITRHALLTYAGRHWPGWQVGLLCGIVRMEAWGRRLWARLRGEDRAAALYRQMGRLARDLGRGDAGKVRRRLAHVVRLGDPR
jgi:N-acetylglucosaminyl-diphospho-decaprenol L-rhamnosyltransferase